MDGNMLLAIILGLSLGMGHAFDPDHVVAVSTNVSKSGNPFRAVWIGISWGLGHTTTLFVVGMAVLVLKLAVPAQLALFFEFSVGILLVFLGLQVLWGFFRKGIHLHTHIHQEGEHGHFHAHPGNITHTRHHELPLVGRPFFRLKSYCIGTLHGLAGSAALLLVTLTTFDSVWVATIYIILFGIGSMIAMGVVTIALTVPFSASARSPNFHGFIQATVGVISVLFGVFLMYQIGVVEGLIYP